jgi:predicted N-acyltransferase
LATSVRLKELTQITDIPAQQWNALRGARCPFLRHAFLAALEETGCVGRDTGWQPAHLAWFEGEQLLAAMPVYRKAHSWGEFVFDFAWAQAYERNGLAYYPKLLVAVPYSPVNAARLLVAPGEDAEAMRARMIEALESSCRAGNLSSAHALFLGEEEQQAFARAGWLTRRDVQFHWRNRGYGSFDDYLAGMRSEKRKQLKRERRRVAESGVRYRTVHGHDITPDELRFAFEVHRRTFHLHGHEPYLTLPFFERIARELGAAFMVKLAFIGNSPVAAAIFMVGEDTLYGRYWGATGELHSLHFETCYYQGIDYCIAHGLDRFEPGTQGEHKLVRGFEPTFTHSAHYIADPRFRSAIANFLEQERVALDRYAGSAGEHTPFHRG